MKKPNTRTVVSAVIVLVLIIGGFYWYRSAHPSATVKYVTAQATKGTLIMSVSGTGNITVSNSANVSPSISGTVANLAVKMSDHVTKGQTLFTITNDSLDATANKSYTAYLQSKQALAQAQGQVATAQTAVTNLAQDTTVDKAQAALDQANATLAADQSNPANASKITGDQDQVTIAQKTLNAARTSATANVGAVNQQFTNAQLGVTIASKNVDNALADYNSQKTTAALRTVTAPIDGTVTTLNISNGSTLGSNSSAVSSSASSSSNSTPIVIDDLTSLKAVVQVNEVDAASVQAGQKVSMTFDAVSGLTLTGTVGKIDTVGTVTSGVVSYNATVSFDSLDKRVLPGMSVSAAITTNVEQNVLSVPSAAVKTNSTSSYVQIMKNGTPVNQTVEIGDSNDTNTVVTSGLNEGDTVVTQIISSATTTTTSSTGLGGLGALGGGGSFRGGGSGSGSTRSTTTAPGN